MVAGGAIVSGVASVALLYTFLEARRLAWQEEDYPQRRGAALHESREDRRVALPRQAGAARAARAPAEARALHSYKYLVDVPAEQEKQRKSLPSREAVRCGAVRAAQCLRICG
ncbi:unnamed protein product [Prorocentrum cordatum]|uniref:Uncharacterized protein n=1 Tax=Prorocentrum cordatum TaxID=2364126 RepID=A0ABN9SKM8_9DINO|nr:unnamed protein product [Polarella glacialis]